MYMSMSLKTYDTTINRDVAITKFKPQMQALMGQQPQPALTLGFIEPFKNVKQEWNISNQDANWDITIILDNGADASGDDPLLLALSKNIPHALQAYYTITGTKANVCLFKTDYQRMAVQKRGPRGGD